MNDEQPKPQDYANAIRTAGLTIYDPVVIGSDLYIPSQELQTLLDAGLSGFSTKNMPPRTRSKAVKTHICEVLGYPVPKSFKKCKPRFSGQNFDTYVQKSNNLQVWNDELSPSRRYVLIREGGDHTIRQVKVVTGDELAMLDRTGTLTQKYQARFERGVAAEELISATDTTRLLPHVAAVQAVSFVNGPLTYPTHDTLLPITTIFQRLVPLIGRTFEDTGRDQDRNRGAGLHRMVCLALGYPNYKDDGRFPDVRHQLLEVKLQTSPTIDLGLVTPASREPLDIPLIAGTQIRHCDVRYAVFAAATDGQLVAITGFIFPREKIF